MHQLLHLKWTPPRRLSRSSSGFSLLTNPNRFFRSSFLKVVAPPPRSPFKRADRLRATGKRTKQMSWPLLGLSGCYWTDLATFSIRSFKLLLPFPSALPSLSCRGQNTFTIFTRGQAAKDLCSPCVYKSVSYLCSRENWSGWSHVVVWWVLSHCKWSELQTCVQEMVVSTQSSNTHTPYWWLHPNRGARKEGWGGVDRWMDLVPCSACCALFLATTLLCWTCIVISPSWTPLSSRPHKRQLIAPLMSLFAFSTFVALFNAQVIIVNVGWIVSATFKRFWKGPMLRRL